MPDLGKSLDGQQLPRFFYSSSRVKLRSNILQSRLWHASPIEALCTSMSLCSTLYMARLNLNIQLQQYFRAGSNTMISMIPYDVLIKRRPGNITKFPHSTISTEGDMYNHGPQILALKHNFACNAHAQWETTPAIAPTSFHCKETTEASNIPNEGIRPGKYPEHAVNYVNVHGCRV
ncbi:hypothetical protein K503DRAFT_215320 [Rhizopogon vinicolor AM-OR11-026]|uniref:Uncharacterized protein n=1 Tax=Rhizopogon vinicolor AM-OR11-026 TaxID=1314800 RepID=A0A1B7MYP8_9AGAM|nr:hypothetical protein K503DRAFT_215320 [Rhizopogon vinicolor AM-OR11-026]